MSEPTRRQTLQIAGATVIALAAPSLAMAAPRANLWPRWQAHNPSSRQQVDHGAWDQFLNRYRVVGHDDVARLPYGSVLTEDRTLLSSYLNRLAETPISTLSQPEQFSYWVNLYNALTVNVIMDHYPVSTIRDIDISPGLFSNGPWGASLINVEGEALSLDDIEHRILRPIWRDPRIHYVVNCAAVGCPNLPTQALRATSNERILTAAAIAYINDPRGLEVRSDGLTVSRIFDWFSEDFGDLRAHLAQYAQRERADTLAAGVPINNYQYDWSLNDSGAIN